MFYGSGDHAMPALRSAVKKKFKWLLGQRGIRSHERSHYDKCLRCFSSKYETLQRQKENGFRCTTGKYSPAMDLPHVSMHKDQYNQPGSERHESGFYSTNIRRET
ncbi:MAG: hypothetical protein ACRER2_14725 [Methylococcales bacterium]